MRIGLQTWGTEGDLRPFFALGQELAARGHDVTVVYTSVEGRSFDDLGAACGVRAVAAGGERFRSLADGGEAARRSVMSSSPLAQLRWVVARFLDPVVEPMWAAAQELARTSEVMVTHFLCHPAATAAVAAGRPYFVVATAPALRTRQAPPPGLPDLGPLNPLAWRLAERLVDRVFGPRANALRARAGAPLLRDVRTEPSGLLLGVLTAVSPALFPQPRDWDARARVVGFLDVARAAEPWTPPADLEAFLEAGSPPVFMTFGSMTSLPAMEGETAALLAGAAEAAGVRALVQIPSAAAPGVRTGPGIRFVGRLPHAAVLPRCAAVVHHGGAGTTQAALLAGLPSVVVPHGVDQFFWAPLLHAHGAAPRPLPRRRATVARLAARVRAAVASPEMRARAEALGQAMRLERGVARAAELVEAGAAARATSSPSPPPRPSPPRP